ncbi:MAG: hypothetical protein CSA33_09325, partial [Desulfobulbus propionicus]
KTDGCNLLKQALSTKQAPSTKGAAETVFYLPKNQTKGSTKNYQICHQLKEEKIQTQPPQIYSWQGCETLNCYPNCIS